MRSIYKYVLPIGDIVPVTMPEHAVLLSVAEQNGALCLWAEVDPSNREVTREIRLRGTGHPLGDEGRYVGTVAMTYGLVWHVYDQPEKARERA